MHPQKSGGVGARAAGGGGWERQSTLGLFWGNVCCVTISVTQSVIRPPHHPVTSSKVSPILHPRSTMLLPFGPHHGAAQEIRRQLLPAPLLEGSEMEVGPFSDLSKDSCLAEAKGPWPLTCSLCCECPGGAVGRGALSPAEPSRARTCSIWGWAGAASPLVAGRGLSPCRCRWVSTGCQPAHREQ